jgi:hypothetical protein
LGTKKSSPRYCASNKQTGDITVTDWFWGKIKDSLQKTGIPIAYTQNASSTAVEKVLEAPSMTNPVPVPLWQMQEAKTLLKRLVYFVFKDPADLEATLDKILIIKDNQVFLNIAVTPLGPNPGMAEEMKSEVIQELLSEYFKADEGTKKVDEYFNSKGKYLDDPVETKRKGFFDKLVNGWDTKTSKEWDEFQIIEKEKLLSEMEQLGKIDYRDFDPNDDDIPF